MAIILLGYAGPRGLLVCQFSNAIIGHVTRTVASAGRVRDCECIAAYQSLRILKAPSARFFASTRGYGNLTGSANFASLEANSFSSANDRALRLLA